MINGIRIKNLRSLVDTGEIPLKPITILVGKNSSGKSTFARTFPLIRQSIAEETLGPILWWGKYVDFGNFEIAKSRQAESNEISFTFRSEINESRFVDRHNRRRYLNRLERQQINQAKKIEILTTIKLAYKEHTYTSSIEIELYGTRCNLLFNENELVEFKVNGKKIWERSEDRRCVINQQGGLLPQIDFIRRTKEQIGLSKALHSFWKVDAPLVNQVKQQLKRFVHGNVKDEKIDRIQNRIFLCSKTALLNNLRNMPGAPASWLDYTNRITINSQIFKELFESLVASNIGTIISVINQDITRFFSNVRYIEPLRATAQRYYRGQELAVNEIDSTGANVAFYLDSLGSRQKRSFDEWMVKHFGVRVTTSKEGGHITLNMHEGNNNSGVNLADMGFGFSQFLPIVVQLWSVSSALEYTVQADDESYCIVVEQPELHLHPEYQARMADVITSVLNTENTPVSDIKMIIETHSPNLINRFGYLISERKLSPDQIGIIVFDINDEGESVVSESYFSEDGVLINWPYGFFDPLP